MNYAVIEKTTGLVVNIVVWDGQSAWTPGDGFDAVAVGDSGAGIGWSFANGVFTEPTE